MTFLVFKKTLIRRQVEFYNSVQGKNEKISLENDLSTIPIILRSTSHFFRSIVHMLGNGNYSRKNVGRWSISGLSASACLRFFQLKMCVQAKTGIICTYVSKQGDKKWDKEAKCLKYEVLHTVKAFLKKYPTIFISRFSFGRLDRVGCGSVKNSTILTLLLNIGAK